VMQRRTSPKGRQKRVLCETTGDGVTKLDSDLSLRYSPPDLIT